jgi:hypothetical protein
MGLNFSKKFSDNTKYQFLRLVLTKNNLFSLFMMMTTLRDLLICLTSAHIFADFLLQTGRDVARKNESKILLKHSLLAAAAGYLICGMWSEWKIPLVLFSTHLVIDSVKANLGRRNLLWFVGDQAAHLLAILILAVWISRGASSATMHWNALAGGIYVKSLIFLSGMILSVRACDFIVSMATRRLLEQAEQDAVRTGFCRKSSGAPSGGRLIGQMERLMIFLFIMMEYPQGIGFLLAAKSVLRFGEVKDASQRLEAEYIIIGTFMSFSLAILAASAARWIILRL